MIIGYARTSTIDQTAGFEAQLKEFQAVKCKKVFRERVSSVTVRAQLEVALRVPHPHGNVVIPCIRNVEVSWKPP
ncbi:recombinase family protein [Nitrosospira sp. NRS527]|uniref:recombinase family protein n=1 Tax=Nitrosospira sp. NRS527 TaxID=155925 RepID=UPI001AF353D1|nr:recombinase family protein [Nitrosospira sp. NRS527]BCT67558.1 hypothetical protein NNRS527_01144 [Nitrosospira sp. NRS527]